MKAKALPPIPRVGWSEHFEFIADEWKPGDHISIIGKTGRGKTRLLREGLFKLWDDRDRILLFDVKGSDPELQIGKVVTKFPTVGQRRLWRMGSVKQEHFEWYRLVVPRGVDKVGEARVILAEALDMVHKEGNCVLIVDEIRRFTDPRPPNFGLAPHFSLIWTEDRYADVTVVAMTQAPRWVPSEFYEQSSFLYISKLLDYNVRKRLKEIGGNTPEIDAAVMSLTDHEFLFIARDGEVLQIIQHGKEKW